MNIRNKNIGKYALGLIFALIGATANYKSYPIFVQPNYEKGTVVGKNDHMTLGKYPKQEFIIAFKFDNPNYGTQDITTIFSTWNRLNVNDRTAFRPAKNISFVQGVWAFVACVFDVVVLICIAVFIIDFIIYIWNW